MYVICSVDRKKKIIGGGWFTRCRSSRRGLTTPKLKMRRGIGVRGEMEQ
jgi:hypothetical protein